MGPLKDAFLFLFWPFVLMQIQFPDTEAFFLLFYIYFKVNYLFFFSNYCVFGAITVFWFVLKRDNDSPWSANQTQFRGFFHCSPCVPELLNVLLAEVSSLVSESHSFIATWWCSMDISKTWECKNVAKTVKVEKKPKKKLKPELGSFFRDDVIQTLTRGATPQRELSELAKRR